MTVAIETSGTQSATPGTEHTLATVTNAEVLVLNVDIANLAGAEIVELRIYSKVLASGTERLWHRGTYGPGVPGTPMVVSIPMVSPHHYRATLRQVGGSSRNFDWAIYHT